MNLTYNGHDFSTLCVYGDPELSILNSIPDNREVSGRNGTAFIGMTYGVSTVTFSLAVTGTASERRAKLSTLGQWLKVDEPKALYLPDTPDRYYLAVPDGSLDLERGIKGEMTKLTFTLTDPVAYGAEKTVNIPSSGSATFTVGGTAPTMPYNAAAQSVTPDSSTKLYGLRLDDGDVFCVGANTTNAITVSNLDMWKRTVYVNSALSLPTLPSDWFSMQPGSHTIRNYLGTGQFVLKYRERWY